MTIHFKDHILTIIHQDQNSEALKSQEKIFLCGNVV